MARTNKFPHRADIHVKCIEAAMTGKTLTYRELGTSRAMVGRYLDRITHEEALAGRPPLSAVVVRSGEGRPGLGFREAVTETGFIKPGESDLQVWKRALAAVHEYWRPKLDEDDHDDWPTMKS
jgi:hypothetical protein